MIFPLTVTGEPVTENPVGAISPTLVTVPDPPPPPPPAAAIVWFGQDPVIVTFAPATSAGVAVPVPPDATGRSPVTPVVRGRPVALARVALDGVPKAPPIDAFPSRAAWVAVLIGLLRSLVLLTLASPTVVAVARAAMAEADTSPVLIGAAVPVPAPAPVATK